MLTRDGQAAVRLVRVAKPPTVEGRKQLLQSVRMSASKLGEPEAEACMALFESEANLITSAATIAEAPVVADRRNIGTRGAS